MILGDDLQLQHLFYASDLALRTMLRLGIKHYSISFDKNIDGLSCPNLFYEIYNYLAQVLEIDGLTKGNIIVCPPATEKSLQKTINAVITPSKQNNHNHTLQIHLNKYTQQMKTLHLIHI